MPEQATSEFWRNIPAIEKSKVFRPDALPEAYIRNAPTDDERYFVPITDTVSSRPLWISPQRNQWCDVLMAKRAGLVNHHYHPHEAFDVHDYIAMSRAHYEKVGLGAAAIDKLFR
ncbi:MAG TPA: hypothetical protein VGQ27_08120 [Steroidobacteraceae bacterium]|jgi:2,4'-dihydroxyacetophenone dioxygenase|nr:hypothetical protein [Steroidobacteraceae bacterium]